MCEEPVQCGGIVQALSDNHPYTLLCSATAHPAQQGAVYMYIIMLKDNVLIQQLISQVKCALVQNLYNHHQLCRKRESEASSMQPWPTHWGAAATLAADPPETGMAWFGHWTAYWHCLPHPHTTG